MNQSKIEQLEKAIVLMLNFDGWDLTWCGAENTFYDARGFTPKGSACILEMKFRNKYYQDKMLEKKKYDNLMSIPDRVALYFVSDPKGNYLYWLNELDLPKMESIRRPKTTMWNYEKQDKEVYLLPERLASIINKK